MIEISDVLVWGVILLVIYKAISKVIGKRDLRF